MGFQGEREEGDGEGFGHLEVLVISHRAPGCGAGAEYMLKLIQQGLT